MTSEGGAHGDGNVFKVTPGGAQSVVYSFQYGADGSNPDGNLVQGSDGNFYGMTAWGGMPGFNGLGIVFKLTPGRHRNGSPLLHEWNKRWPHCQ